MTSSTRRARVKRDTDLCHQNVAVETSVDALRVAFHANLSTHIRNILTCRHAAQRCTLLPSPCCTEMHAYAVAMLHRDARFYRRHAAQRCMLLPSPCCTETHAFTIVMLHRLRVLDDIVSVSQVATTPSIESIYLLRSQRELNRY